MCSPSSTSQLPNGTSARTHSVLRSDHDMLVGSRDNIAKLKKEGKSLDETIAAKPTAAFDAKWGKKPDAFISYVYQGV